MRNISKRDERPFPIKSPADLMRANIVSDRQGIALLINLEIISQGEECQALSGVWVDIWHCDAAGDYSEYGGSRLQEADYTERSFLRGRQKTDEQGQVSFISIFPGWYPGRAPHIHVEVLDGEKSLLSTQIAFPEESTAEVYASRGYKGREDTSNSSDMLFADSIFGNLADSLTGNLSDGFTLSKVITV